MHPVFRLSHWDESEEVRDVRVRVLRRGNLVGFNGVFPQNVEGFNEPHFPPCARPSKSANVVVTERAISLTRVGRGSGSEKVVPVVNVPDAATVQGVKNEMGVWFV